MRVSKYQEYERELNMSGIKYPIDVKDTGKFEYQNNISVNVYRCKDKKIFPLPITTIFIARHYVNLPYITADETSRYILVKDLSRLVSRQYNNHKNKTYFCQYCLHGCTSEEVLENYLGRSKLPRTQKVKLPETDDDKRRDKVKFTKAEYQLRLPFVIYADFESVSCKQDSCKPSSLKSFTPNTSITYHVGAVRHHNHLTGEYRGPAQNACNLNYHINPKNVKIPCIIHNIKGILFLFYSYFHDCLFLKLVLIVIFMILISIAIFFYLHHL